MHLTTLLLPLTLLSLHQTPTHAQEDTTPTLPPTSKSTAFTITAAIPPDTPYAHATNWSLTIHHHLPSSSTTSNDTATILLTPPPTRGTPFYENGTSATFAARTSQILTDQSTPGSTTDDDDNDVQTWAVTLSPPVDGVVVRAARVGLVRGEGAVGWPGVQVAEWPATVYLGTGTWFVCGVTEGLGLFWRQKGERTPEGCSNAELQAWCVWGDGGGVEHEFSRESTCYESA